MLIRLINTKISIAVSSILLGSFVCSNLMANEFYNSSREGYFYYKDPIVEKKKEKKQKDEKPSEDEKIKKEQQEVSNIKSDYSKTKEKMKLKFETKEERGERHKAEKQYIENIPWSELDELSADEYRLVLDTTREISVATPNKQYVKSYAALQKFWVDKSEQFAKTWQVANLENPDELIYPEQEWNPIGQKMKQKQSDIDDKRFFEKIKDRVGFIVIVEDKNDKDFMFKLTETYRLIQQKVDMDYIIYDFYEVPHLVRKLKLDRRALPENFILYKGLNGENYQRIVKGFPNYTQIISRTKFIFENAILEKDKHPEDRLENNKDYYKNVVKEKNK